jgi:hypothetical protein
MAIETLTPRKRASSLVMGAGLLAFGDKMGKPYVRAAFTGQWEGYERNRFRDRPPIRFGSQDTDLNYAVRETMNSEARSLEQTFPIVKSIKKRYADYCVGKCNVRWNTGDKKIDMAYRKAWNYWKTVCDYRALHDFPTLMKLAVGQSFSEGDMFVQQVLSSGRAMLNMIEADRVSSNGIYNFDSDDMVGGIGLDPATKRHKFIRVWERSLYGTFKSSQDIPVSDYKHLFDPSRVDAARGVTGYHAALNALRDLKEIMDAERIKTKRNSKLALIAKTITGEAPPVNFGDSSVTKTSDGFSMETLRDGTTAYTFPSESITAHEGVQSTAWIDQITIIIRNIALAVNLPMGVVWSMAGLNKPAVLFELQQAARTITAFQDQLESRLIRPIVGWWLSVEMKAGRLPFTPNWFEFSISRPPYISIDAGRDSAAAINENKAGMRSLAKWYDETDDYWEDEVDQCVFERSYLEKACKIAGIDPNNVRMMTPNGNVSGSGALAQKEDDLG